MFRPGQRRGWPAAAEQLELGFRRPGADRVIDSDGEERYLHLFDPTQPDLNWRERGVRRVRDGAAVLARPRCRRIPGGCGDGLIKEKDCRTG